VKHKINDQGVMNLFDVTGEGRYSEGKRANHSSAFSILDYGMGNSRSLMDL
jgi:hypothetical protein